MQCLEVLNELDLVHDAEEEEQAEGTGRRKKNCYMRSPSIRLGVDRIDAYSDIDFN